LLNIGRIWIRNELDHCDWSLAAEIDTFAHPTLVGEMIYRDYTGEMLELQDTLEYLIGVKYTDKREYEYGAGIGYRPMANVSNWRLITGVTITF